MFEFGQLGREGVMEASTRAPPPRGPWGFFVFSCDMGMTDVSMQLYLVMCWEGLQVMNFLY